MSTDCLYAGVDVSKAKLDLAVRRNGRAILARSFANTKPGIRQLLKTLASYGLPCRTVLEPTSRFHLPLLIALASADGCQVMPVNPYRARKYQEARGKRAKTDPLDAQNLACLAEQLAAEFIAYTPVCDELRELQMLGRQVSTYARQRGKARNRISAVTPDGVAAAEIIAGLRREIDFYQSQIKSLLGRMHAIVDADPQWRLGYTLLMQIRGIGKQSALQLLSELLPLPGGMQPRQWTACAGLDPRPQSSGLSNPPARISKMGNQYLKQVLYMAALTTTQFDPQIQRYYKQLHQRKQSKTLALVVIMRRLLTGIWWVLHKQQPLDVDKCFRIPA